MFVKVKELIKKLPVLVLCVLVLCLSGCNKVKQIKVTSVALESVGLRGLKGLDVGVAVGVDNPAFSVDLSEIEGALKHSGKILGNVAVAPFTLQGKTAGTYRLNADITLGENATVLDLGRLLDKRSLDEMFVDVSAMVKIKKGPARRMELKDIPLKKLIETVK